MAKASRFRESKLQRAKARRPQQPRFVLLSEGANSEPFYFTALKPTLKVALTIYRAAGTPDAIADAAIEKKKALMREGGWRQGTDQIWAIFDRDEHEHFDDAVVKCRDNGIHVARSNPCFEVWLILHFEQYHREEHRHDVFKRLCGILPTYEHGKGRDCDFSKLIALLDEAEKRAAAQLKARNDEGAEFGPPSTTVHMLTEALRQKNKSKKKKK